jgi:hypothetical protein
MPDLGAIVRQRPLASTAGTGDSYSLGYSAPGRLRLGHLDANYWRVPARGQPVQPSACADARLGQPQRVWVAVPRWCTGRLVPTRTLSSPS